MLGPPRDVADGPPASLFLQVSQRELEWLRGLEGQQDAPAAAGASRTTEAHGEFHFLPVWRVAEAWRLAAGLTDNSSRSPCAPMSTMALPRSTPPWRRPLPYYYINLERSHDRRRLQEDQARARGLVARRICGEEPPFSRDAMELYGARMMLGPMDDGSHPQTANAVVLSVLAALRRCVGDKAPFFILSEDDAMLLLDFYERLELLWRSAPLGCNGLCLHSASLAIHTQLMELVHKTREPAPLVHKEWPTYGDGHIWAPHEVICNDPLIFLLSGDIAQVLLELLETHLLSYQWSPIDWLLPEIIKRKHLPIHLVNPAALRLVGAPFGSDRNPSGVGTAGSGWQRDNGLQGGCVVAPGVGCVDF